MSTVVNVQQAKTHLSDLLARAERGEEIVIARAGQPIVRLTPITKARPREFGTMRFSVPDDDFFDPLPADELDAWE